MNPPPTRRKFRHENRREKPEKENVDAIRPADLPHTGRVCYSEERL